MSKKRFYQTLLSALCLFVLLTGLAACINDKEDDSETKEYVGVGNPVPAFTLLLADGSLLTSDELKGRPFVLCFFDTTCPDCQREFPVLQQIHDGYGQKAPVVCVPRSQTLHEVEAYWQEHALTVPFFLPQDARLYYRFANRIIPRTYVVDANGIVCASFGDSPIADYASLAYALDTLLHKD